MDTGNPPADPVLRWKNGAVSVSGQLMVGDIDLELAAGETGCLLGATGSGKTTVLRSIAGLVPAQAGALWIRGRLLDHKTPAHLRKIAMAPQSPQLMTDRTVRENVALGLMVSTGKERLALCLETFDLTALADRPAGRLSGGQARLVSVARAIAPAPDLLLLDEPGTGLDRQLKEHLPSLVRRLLPTHSAILMTTHDYEEAFAWADRLGILKHRRIDWQRAQSVWQRPGSSAVARAAGLGHLISGQIELEGAGKYRLSTAVGAITLAEISEIPQTGAVTVLVRPGEITLEDGSDRQQPQVRVERFEMRSGQAGLRLRTVTSSETLWAPCPSGQQPVAGHLCAIAWQPGLSHLCFWPERTD